MISGGRTRYRPTCANFSISSSLPSPPKIAWDKPITWLSQETLPPPSSLAESPPHPKGIVDALLRVHLRNGHPHHHLLLLEIQAHPLHSFPLRMFLYFSSLLQQYKENLLPAAVLTDLNPNWKPSEFHYQIFDCQLSFRFPICKLLELEDRCKNFSSFCSDGRPPPTGCTPLPRQASPPPPSPQATLLGSKGLGLEA
ncbi:MAG: hypothetical protein NZL93_04940 [Chthoniobacterales bacterium]|nr:hypothetical protein [Chthoniobacterales bacterium]